MKFLFLDIAVLLIICSLVLLAWVVLRRGMKEARGVNPTTRLEDEQKVGEANLEEYKYDQARKCKRCALIVPEGKGIFVDGFYHQQCFEQEQKGK
jgi:hypothetical protein